MPPRMTPDAPRNRLEGMFPDSPNSLEELHLRTAVDVLMRHFPQTRARLESLLLLYVENTALRHYTYEKILKWAIRHGVPLDVETKGGTN